MSSIITLPSGNEYTLITLPSYPGVSDLSVTFDDTVANVASPYVPAFNQTQSWPGADNWSLSFTLPR